ncbi:MAG: hypothetical protein OIF36_04475 [Alphaproteobacteria bacterium]|jgi:hypothetical protein|nr:hypothetical protein [Alphaproteobacteria bacterium]MCV6599711.1 hypothetical protein [Alphaproteobacteria bacterium]
MINNNSSNNAWVVFCKNTDLRILKFLKSGFKHCFVILNDGDNWITYDPMSSFTDIMVHKTPISFDLPGWFAKRGDKVIRTFKVKHNNVVPLSFYTCVESVKRILGINKVFILTPYQLYKYLIKINLKKGDC